MDRKLAAELKRAGNTYAMIGKILGVSRQRVQQSLSPPLAIRKLLLNRSKFSCEFCGVLLEEKGQVHHLSYNIETFNDLENLKYLCIPCHVSEHSHSPIISSHKDCIYCNSSETKKIGPYWSGSHLVQRYQCKDCGKTFSSPLIEKSIKNKGISE